MSDCGLTGRTRANDPESLSCKPEKLSVPMVLLRSSLHLASHPQSSKPPGLSASDTSFTTYSPAMSMAGRGSGLGGSNNNLNFELEGILTPRAVPVPVPVGGGVYAATDKE